MSLSRPRKGPWLQVLSPAGFEWNIATLQVPGLPEALRGLRIIQLTDIHLTEHWWPAYDEIIQRINANPPDLLFITGDFVWQKWDNRHVVPLMRRLVDPLRAKSGIYAVLGNHDGEQVGPYIAASQARLIEGEMLTIDVRGQKVDLIGMNGATRYDPDYNMLHAILRREKSPLRIVLAHYPDTYRRIASAESDLFFAGHTHGGQICLPGGFPLITHDSLPRKYAKGIHRIDNTWLVISRGIGFTSIPVRMFCPSEVIEVVLE
jgi:predicted MPP superfamily phosphohydrolase